MLRVLIIPPHAPAYVHNLSATANWDELYPLLGYDTFDSVVLEQDGRVELSLVLDDEGIAHGGVPHLWCRGAVIHGAAALGQWDMATGEQVDLDDAVAQRLLRELNSGVPAALPHQPFGRIRPGDEELAYKLSRAMRAEAVKEMRKQGQFVIELDETPPTYRPEKP